MTLDKKVLGTDHPYVLLRTLTVRVVGIIREIVASCQLTLCLVIDELILHPRKHDWKPTLTPALDERRVRLTSFAGSRTRTTHNQRRGRPENPRYVTVDRLCRS